MPRSPSSTCAGRSSSSPRAARGTSSRGSSAPARKVIGVDVNAELLDAAAGRTGDLVSLYHADYFTDVDQWGLEGDDEAMARSPDFVVTNPPFSRGEEFVDLACERWPNATVAMFLRLGILESDKRIEFNQRRPAHFHVFSKRPSFVNGSTDFAAYAFFLYGKTIARRGWDVLDCRPFFNAWKESAARQLVESAPR